MRSELEREQLAVNTIKGLAMDAVQLANSGHPGMPMGMAELGVVLWNRYLKVDPGHPTWPDRDRFVLSNGHGSMLLYSLLHLSGFHISLDDLKRYRQWGSPTAGHPELDPELGIETTTGPLGQGFGTGVGMAIAEAHLSARLGSDLVDHRTFGFVSDGDLMEGISAETASLAGHLGLGKLIYYYDDNGITIDGSTDITFSEDVPQRFGAVGWHTITIDGHDREAIAAATEAAIGETSRPSLVVAKTHIAHGAPTKQDTAAAHGQPLGEAEIAATKAAMGWPVNETFTVPDVVVEMFAESMGRGRAARVDWLERKESAFASDPELAETWERLFNQGTVKLDDPGFEVGAKIATRAAGGKLFGQMASAVPGLIGGAADLVGSTKTEIAGSPIFSATERLGRNIAFGIREHAMGALVNGIGLHGGLRAFGSTFFVFSDYMRPAVRLSALMGIPSLWVWTHDSFFLGGDGPTHQPIEHLASLRAMPNLWVVRPADASETVEAFELALNRTSGPTAIVLTRQDLPTLARSRGGVARGGYVLRDGSSVTLIATGSEVQLALDAADLLAAEGIEARVVSLPCWEAFENQEDEYRAAVIGDVPTVSIEAGSTFGWERITGPTAMHIGIDHFGASAPGEVLATEFGFTADAVASQVRSWLE